VGGGSRSDAHQGCGELGGSGTRSAGAIGGSDPSRKQAPVRSRVGGEGLRLESDGAADAIPLASTNSGRDWRVPEGAQAGPQRSRLSTRLRDRALRAAREARHVQRCGLFVSPVVQEETPDGASASLEPEDRDAGGRIVDRHPSRATGTHVSRHVLLGASHIETPSHGSRMGQIVSYRHDNEVAQRRLIENCIVRTAGKNNCHGEEPKRSLKHHRLTANLLQPAWTLRKDGIEVLLPVLMRTGEIKLWPPMRNWHGACVLFPLIVLASRVAKLELEFVEFHVSLQSRPLGQRGLSETLCNWCGLIAAG
jgi:hypothetical protein